MEIHDGAGGFLEEVIEAGHKVDGHCWFSTNPKGLEENQYGEGTIV